MRMVYPMGRMMDWRWILAFASGLYHSVVAVANMDFGGRLYYYDFSRLFENENLYTSLLASEFHQPLSGIPTLHPSSLTPSLLKNSIHASFLASDLSQVHLIPSYI